MNIRDTVQMMPQDGEVRSEHDLGFMTEVDAEFKLPAAVPKDREETTDQVISTRHSEVEGNTSMPHRSSALDIDRAEFKQVIKEIISKE